MIVKPIKTHVFKENENLTNFIFKYIKKIKENSIIVITSKIVSLSENRTSVIENIRTKEELIKKESDFAMPTKYVWLTIKNGVVMATAGIDESNANGKLILLPKDSYKSASLLHKELRLKYKVKNLGILITDSRTMPLRAGVIGVALGYKGFYGIKNYKNKPDIFGRKFKFSKTDVADSLATSAVFVMGEGNEQQPIAIIENAPVQFSNKVNKNELYIDIKEDMYQPIFSKLNEF